MLIIPLYGLCALAATGIFFPWIKAPQEPSMSLLYTASAISQDCFKDFSDWLQLSTENAGRVVSRPLSSLPRIIYLPTPCSSSSSSSNNIGNGTKGFIVLPTVSSLATVTQSENSLSLVTPFKVRPSRSPPPLSAESGSAIDNETGKTFGPEELTISNYGLPLFLGLVFSVLTAFHLVVYVLWKWELAKLDRQMEEAMGTASKMLEDLSKAKIVLDKTEDSYLKGIMDDLETTSKQTSSSSEAQIEMLEHLYTEGDSSAPVLFSTKQWTTSKSEYESKYGAVRRAPPSVEPSTAVPPLPIEDSKTKRSDSDSASGNDKGPVEANNAQSETGQSDNGGRPTTRTYRISTVVPDIHVERPSVRKRPFLPVAARHSRRPQRPPTRPSILDRIATPAMVDIHAGDPSDTNTALRRRNVSSPSTMVDIRVEGASDRNLVRQTEHPIHVESPPEPVTPSVPVTVTDTVEPSAMVDIHAEGAPVAKVTGAGSNNADNGYDSSTSLQTTILASRTPSAATATAIPTAIPIATATATARVEIQASPQNQTESPQTGRRRRNRMGQRQRRRLREMREIENRGWEGMQQSSQQGGEEE
ncbi:hypothetical protein TCE0_042f14412 [Talaromyces pinophilus]|uniref:Uncharacterized protein n=1 Tax=Talaromyces pinophilus TaxID=128442 RepID=A0A6V8HI23_TALPI|nr:hypothetical protein TCE0_042f14412 [Talaromyces pinophilus]